MQKRYAVEKRKEVGGRVRKILVDSQKERRRKESLQSAQEGRGAKEVE